jgi:cytochrome c-type biogenesis protein CcmH
MTLFALLIAAMILVALALLLPAFLRRDDTELTDRQTINVRIARERLAELEVARDTGELEPAEFEQASGELEQSLAQDLAQQAKAGRRGGKALLLVLMGLIPAAALGIYLQLGSPQFLDLSGPGAGRATEGLASPQGEPPATVEEMIARLESRLETAPNDPDGWYMLGRSYMSLNDYPKAVAAYEQLLEVVGEHPAALVALADAIAMTQEGNVLGRPEELLQRALVVAPEDPTALWLAGKAAEEREDYRGAVEYWMKALPAMAERADLANELRTLIAQAALKAGMSVEELAAFKPAGAEPAAAAVKGVKVRVRISPELLGEVAPEDTVFVFARAVSGPPMPLAVGRYTLATLPGEIVLDDSSAMSPQLRISGFEQVAVQARVAKGGQPTAQSGDLQSEAVQVAVGGADVIEVVIDQQVP